MLAELTLLVALVQSPPSPDPELPLVFGSRVVLMRKSEVERLLEGDGLAGVTLQQLHVAYVLALGTRSTPQSLPPNNTRAFWDNEIRRGVRRPAQAP